ncbi:MAG: hypothetical protein IJR32_00600 [Paludibacteraceae bacterium]|jgi:hypothetical protein|nr:hypothetical protein [Paludibacteraceae bacterium]
MKSILIRLSGVLIILLGVILLAVYHFTAPHSNALLIGAGAAFLIGLVWFIFSSQRTRF